MMNMHPTFDAQVGPHRRAIHVHCYRMTGSYSDADDLVQDTLVRAWRAIDSYDAATGDVGLRRWLYRIATNACLDFLKSAARRHVASGSPHEVPWLEPYPDGQLPDEAIAAKETIALGYLVLIQQLPPRQRAAFVLRDVLGWSAAETAEALELTVPAANSALQRARETMAQHRPAAAPSEADRAVLAAFIDAHQRGDVSACVAMMAKDLRITMPPHPMCFVGMEQIERLLVRAFVTHPDGEWRLVSSAANGMLTALSYLKKPGDTLFRAFKLDVMRVEGGKIAEITTFGVKHLAAFGAPAILEVP